MVQRRAASIIYNFSIVDRTHVVGVYQSISSPTRLVTHSPNLYLSMVARSPSEGGTRKIS